MFARARAARDRTQTSRTSLQSRVHVGVVFFISFIFYPFLWRRGVKLFVRWLVSTLLKIDGTSKKNLDSDQSQGLKM